MIVRDMIRQAALELGVIAGTEQLTGDQLQDGLLRLQALADSISADGDFIIAIGEVAVALTASQNVYSVLRNDGRPVAGILREGLLTRDGNVASFIKLVRDTDLSAYNAERFAANGPMLFSDQLIFSPDLPAVFSFNNGQWQVNVPDFYVESSYTLNLKTQLDFNELDPSDSLMLPQGWERYLMLALAMETAAMYGVQVSAETQRSYTEAKRIIVRAGARRIERKRDFTLQRMSIYPWGL